MQIYIKFCHTHPFLGYTVTCKTDSEIRLWDFEMAARGTTIKDGPGDSAARAGKCLISTIVLRGQIHWVLIHALIFLPPEKCVLFLRLMLFVAVKMGLSVKWGYLVPRGLDNNNRLPPLIGEGKCFPGSRNCCQCSDSTAPETRSPVLEAPTHPLPLQPDNNLIHRTSIPITFAP